jgi:hemoglobin
MQTENVSMYENIGGKRVLDELVDYFYAQVLLDPSLAPWFRGIDVRALRNHQVQFLSALLGGPAYTGRSLAEAHKGLGVTPEAFEKVAQHLSQALSHFEVPQRVIQSILSAAIGSKDQVVAK